MANEHTLEITAKTDGKRFSLSTDVLEPLGLKADDWVWLRVKDATSGGLIFEGNHRMKMGTEINGPVFQNIKGNQALKVTIARPK
ncbi:MAG: hypothetical protein ABI690_16935 [Chloroflexota bacterium]